MPPTPTKESLKAFIRLRHSDVTRRGKPRIGQVTAEGVELLIDLDPVPSYQWWNVLNESVAGTVLEGRTAAGGNQLKIQSCEDELEHDVRRGDDLLEAVNRAYNKMFENAKRQYEEIVAGEKKKAGEDANVVKRRLEDRLKGL